MNLFDRHGHPIAQRNVLHAEQSAKPAKPARYDGLTSAEWERRHGERIEANRERVEREQLELSGASTATCRSASNVTTGTKRRALPNRENLANNSDATKPIADRVRLPADSFGDE